MPVEVVVQVLVNLLLLAVLAEQPTKHALTPHPKELRGHARFAPAAALAGTGVPALADGEDVLAHSCAGVHLDRLPDDQAVLQELADVVARVRHGDLAGLIRVQPDATSAALLDGGGKA